MLTKLLKLLQTELASAHPAPEEHIHRGAALRLPEGAIIAEQGLRHLPRDARGRSVQALMDEAYVVVRTDPLSQWYATWRPYSGGWDLLRMQDELPLEDAPASLRQARRAIC
jgi:hypothetical protein